MKPLFFPIALSLGLLPALASAQEGAEAPAPAASPATAPKQEEDPTLGQLEKLTPEQQDKVKKAISEASTFVGGIRLQEALQRLAEAESITPDLFMVHNLKGAVFTKMRLFEKARASFKKAQELHPKSFHPKFNLAEIEFVEAADKARAGDDAAAATQFESAQKLFEALIAGKTDVGTQKLIEFKIVVCQLKQGKIAEAEAAAKAFSYIDDEPVYYLSHAAIEFHKGDKAAAQEWIDSANRIYTPQQVTIYMDSFIEVGWVETLAL
jgi:Tfp pilus assembly protein PilF